MAPRRSPRLHPLIDASEKGDGTGPSEDGAGATLRRRRGASPAEPASLPDDDDMLREILIRLPPQPSSLPRASAVCRRWRGLVTDPKFHRQFYAHHRKPPLLGVFELTGQGVVFTPVLDPPDRVYHGRCSRSNGYDVLGCRHGRLLVLDEVRKELLLWAPITGEKRRVAIPPDFKGAYVRGAVLCAAVHHGHVHHGCHRSPFKVVLLDKYTRDKPLQARVYYSETGLWGDLITTDPFAVNLQPAVLVGNSLYWLAMDDGILEFDLDENKLTVMRGPPLANYIDNRKRQIIPAENGALGCAVSYYPRFLMWQRNITGHGVATWVPWKTIEMHTILGLPSQINKPGWKQIIGYDEDIDAVILHVGCNVYMVQLKKMQSTKLYEANSIITRCHPFTSFYTPGTAINGVSNGSETLHDT